MIVRTLDYVTDYRLRSESTKFAHDGMAEYIYDTILLDGMEDEHSGDCDFGFADRVGKRIIWGQTSGAVYLERYANEDEAKADFAQFDAKFSEYADEWGF